MSLSGRDLDELFTRFMATMPIRRVDFGIDTKSSMRRGGIFRDFDTMRRVTERMVEEAVYNIEILPPNLIRQYQTPEGEIVQEIGPIVCGCAASLGPDGLPQIREFGNVRSSATFGGSIRGSTGGVSMLKAEREPQIGIVTTDKEIRIVAELPGVDKQDVRVNTFDNTVEISTSDRAARKYRAIIEVPQDAEMGSAKSSYNNGILEIIFNKESQSKTRGRQVRVD